MLNRRLFLKHLAFAASLALPLPALARLSSPSDTGLFSESRVMMGTFVTLKVSGVSEAQAADAIGSAFARMEALEAALTRFGSSPLGELNRAGVLRDIPTALAAVLRAAKSMHTLTGGVFEPAVLPLLERLEAESSPQLSPAELAELAPLINMERVSLSEREIRFQRSGMKISLDGIAKGYIADEGARALRETGVQNFLLNAGGDIVASGAKGEKPWRVAVENPAKYRGKTDYPAVLSLTRGAMATSGGYEREKAHIFNPVTGQPSTLPSATVLAPTAMEADALATALCVLSQPITFTDNLPKAACLLVMPGGKVQRSRNWRGQVRVP